MQQVDKYLEKRGAKYFVTLLMFFYVIGTVIFNVYLKSLGSFEFEVLQLRYMFVGAMFGIVTSIFPLVLWVGYKVLKAVRPNWFVKEEKLTKTQRQKRSRRIWLQIEIIGLLFLIPWTGVYALHIFPEIPAGFGGARPIVARLIGEKDSIKKINDLVAFETGVPPEKLPFEQVPGNEDLAIGANVKILDRNKDRVFLLLTKDLYLSSTSGFVKKLIDLGLVEDDSFETIDTENLIPKPLIVKASKIEGITSTLYIPPAVTTVADLEIAKQVLMNNPDNFEEISAIISQDLPGVGEALVAAFKKDRERKLKPVAVAVVSPNIVVDTLEDVKVEPIEKSEETITEQADVEVAEEPIESEIELERMEKFDLETALEEVLSGVDSVFLNFRNRIYAQVGYLEQTERRTGRNSTQRRILITDITDTMKAEFPIAWAKIDLNNNYLIIGQQDEAFASNILKAFRGAESAEQIIQRLNDINPAPKSSTFDDTISTAKTLVRNLTDVNTLENRKFVSQQLVDHFNGKAPRDRAYWSDTKYLSAGAEEERYFERLGKLLNTKNWEEFGVMSLDMYHTIESHVEPDPIEEVLLEEEVVPTDETGDEAPSDTETGTTDPANSSDTGTLSDSTNETTPVDDTATETTPTDEPADEIPPVDGSTSEVVPAEDPVV